VSPTPDASVTGSIVKQESQASDGVLADLDEMSQRSWRSDSPEKVSSAGRSAAQEVAIGKPRERQTIVTAPSSVMPRRVRLELVRFSFMSVGRIDCVEQSFRAQIFFELRIPGAAHDPDLSAEGDTFPQPPPGQLPRPPARWFMNQIDIKNFMVHAQPLNSHCFKRGDDIHLSLRYEGDFMENMELEYFPFDMQELSIDLAINCRTTGAVPCDLVVAEDAVIGISRDGFALHQLYALDGRLSTFGHLVGDEPNVYPSITISARVYRNPGFVVINVMMPTALFVLMGFVQFLVPTGNQEVRLDVTLTLVLTLNVYKFYNADMMPNVSYITIVDAYVLLNTGLLMLLVFQGGIVGLLTQLDTREIEMAGGEIVPFFLHDWLLNNLTSWRPQAAADGKGQGYDGHDEMLWNRAAMFDAGSLAVGLGAYVCIHLYFIISICLLKRARYRIDTSNGCRVHNGNAEHAAAGAAATRMFGSREDIPRVSKRLRRVTHRMPPPSRTGGRRSGYGAAAS